MRRNLELLSLACGVALAMVAGGCQTSTPSARRPSAKIDPCAERLHDICGRLLLYYRGNGKLPVALADMKGLDSGALPPLVCPLSDKPYIYRKDGLRVTGRPGLLVLYDAEPVHSGMRWGISVETASEGQPLTGRVVLLPDSPLFSAKK
jgi:hypothetical protein